MQEKSLKLYNTEKTFFVKVSSALSKLLTPTKIGFNSIMISIKRNNLIKSYYNYKAACNLSDSVKEESANNKYEDAYTLYLESIDKYIMESLYKRVKQNLASQYEKNALSKYYTIVSLKEDYYLEYKYKKQRYLLELDYDGLLEQSKQGVMNKFKSFYVEKMDSLYKAIIKNYSLQLADSITKKISKDDVYEKIFSIIEEYIDSILPIKLEQGDSNQNKELAKAYENYQNYEVGKINNIEAVEKKLELLGISRLIFTHSLPLVTADKCYVKLLKDVRKMLVENKSTNKYNRVYDLLLKVIEEYNLKLLSTKVYWDKKDEREQYKSFWDEYKSLQAIKQTNSEEYKLKREILFIKNDLKALCASKSNYEDIINIYKNRLSELGEIRNIKNKCATRTKLTGKICKTKAC